MKKLIRATLREAYYCCADGIDLLIGRRDELTPPRRMVFVGNGNFKKIGEEFFSCFVKLGDLKPSESVLDVGSGIGRMAIPLTKYLDQGGSYEGFDIVPDGIRWCNEKISPRFPNFRFQLVDLHNKRYNPRGKYNASDFRFPYESDSFDFVFLTSVLTHMLPKDLENYLGEIARVLKRGGRCLSTFFLLNRGSAELINAGKSTLPFKYDCGDYRTIDLDTPESAVCYDELFILSLYERNSLTIKHPIRYGSWCKRSKPLSYQDIVIASK